MNTLIAVSIAPSGVGDELSSYVAEVVKVIRESGLPNKTTSMFTEIEGDWDEVMNVVKKASFVLAERGIRTEVVIKADIRPGFTNMMNGKIDRLNKAMNNIPSHEKTDTMIGVSQASALKAAMATKQTEVKNGHKK